MKQRNGGTTIYALCDPVTGEIRYVGKTNQTAWRRQRDHVLSAGRGLKTRCAHWIRSVGQPAVRPLLIVPINYGCEMETRVIARFRSLGYRLTNITDGGEGTTGWSPTPETRAKIAAKALGRKLRFKRLRTKPVSDQERANLSAAVRRRGPRSKACRAKLSAALRGKKRTPEQCNNIRAGQLKKAPPSAETRAKISAANRGLKRSPEARARISAGLIERVVKPAQRAKMRAALLGRKRTEEQRAAMSGRVASAETRARMSVAQKARFARAKAVA